MLYIYYMFYNNHMLNIIIKLQTSFKIRTRDGHRFSKLKTNEILHERKINEQWINGLDRLLKNKQ